MPEKYNCITRRNFLYSLAVAGSLPLIGRFKDSPRSEKVKIVGVGGAGNRFVSAILPLKLRDVEHIAVNTNAQALNTSPIPVKLWIWPDFKKDMDRIADLLKDADIVFITAGMGGAAGTGAAPVIAKVAKHNGAKTIVVITEPFSFEGIRRAKRAGEGIKELKKYADKLITFPLDQLLNTIPKQTPLSEAFKIADEIIRELIIKEYNNRLSPA